MYYSRTTMPYIINLLLFLYFICLKNKTLRVLLFIINFLNSIYNTDNTG